jgi:histidinol dehydrogenase
VKIIDGYARAKSTLTRKAAANIGSVTPALRDKLRGMFGTGNPEQVVRRIINDVRIQGDAALKKYTREIEGVDLVSFTVEKEIIDKAYSQVSPELVSVLKLAAERIRLFHLAQKRAYSSDVSCKDSRQILRPIKKVGVYIPGGIAAYPSTVLMTVVPARVAGVDEIVLTTPPKADGGIPPLVVVAADIAGANQIYSIGGAQAIAAMAYGTESVPKVDKIYGPGNIFVMLAKKMVYGTVGIDGLEGPSEVFIIADEGTIAGYCAADLLAQAEHDPLAAAILVTPSRNLAEQVNNEIESQLRNLPRRDIAVSSLNNRGHIIVVNNVEEAISLANLYAPEHLCLMVEDADKYVDRVDNAGCIFVGRDSAEVLGDYIAGPSHTLPTGGTARFASALNIMDFNKLINIVAIDRDDSKILWQAAAEIARAEGLEGHALAAEKRLDTI